MTPKSNTRYAIPSGNSYKSSTCQLQKYFGQRVFYLDRFNNHLRQRKGYYHVFSRAEHTKRTDGNEKRGETLL